MPSYLDDFLNKLKGTYTKTIETAKPLFVDAVNAVSPHIQQIGKNWEESGRQAVQPKPIIPKPSSIFKGNQSLTNAIQDAAGAESRQIIHDLQQGIITEKEALKQLKFQNKKFNDNQELFINK